MYSQACACIFFPNSAKLYKLQATSSGGVTGLSFTAKVMSGDTVNIFGKSYYFQNNTAQQNYNIPFTSILTGLLGGSSIAAGKATLAELSANTAVTQAITAGLQDAGRNNSGTAQTPKAYINYMLFDEQFKAVKTGFSRVGSANAIKDHFSELQNIPVTKNGYLYVYVSNESPVAVFFDNLQVVQTRGPIVEETHYYPFGLTMAGISSKASSFGQPENHYKYNGKEEQRKEFSDGSGLEWLDYGARMYDNQIGRWMVQDNYSEVYYGLTPYNYAGNTPINAFDVDGNLFIFANGFMLNQYLAGQKSPERIAGTEARVKPNPGYSKYAPDRGFYKDGPRNNGQKFESDYWEGVDAAYKTVYDDENAYYTNGSFTPNATADARLEEGKKAAEDLIAKLESGEITLKDGEKIKIVGHSQGAAYAAGIATGLLNSKYGSLIEFVDYLSPHQPGDIRHPALVKGRQFSTQSDVISSIGPIAKFFGGSKYEKIPGAEWGKERLSHEEGRAGHSLGTWLNNLIDYWKSLGIKVTVQ